MDKFEEEFSRKLLSYSPDELKSKLAEMKSDVSLIHASFLESAKPLAVLNGASAAAMLGLISPLVKEGQFIQLKFYVLVALSTFMLGAVLAVLVPFARGVGTMLEVIGHPNRNQLFRAGLIVLITSAVAFLLGASTIVIGLVRVF